LAKNKKKRRTSSLNRSEKRQKKSIPVKKLVSVVALFAISTALYYAFASAGYGIVYPIYVTLAGILIIAYFIMNKGLVTVPDRTQLSDEMTEAEKDAFLAEIKENKRRSEPILYVFLAITLTVLCDTLYAQVADGFVGEAFGKIMGALKK
jgi:hypothetical protein